MTTLSEWDSKQRLRRFGLPFAEERLVHTAEQAVAAADELGYPVAIKLGGAAIAHKTERGLVRLGVATPAAVAAGASALLAAVRPSDGAVHLLVARMLTGRRELIAGLHHDRIFGMTVMLGVGGVLAEATADVVFRLVPVSERDAHEMIGELAGQRLFGSFRGEPPVDRQALAAVLVALSRAAETDEHILSADLNPIIIQGTDPVAVDALVELSPEPAGTRRCV